MKRWYSWLTPSFLKRWDMYLLENYPVVWRTRGIYVLWFAAVLTPVLFLAGFFYPVHNKDFTVWAVDPIRPIVLGDENFYVLPMAGLSLGILWWGVTQFQAGFSWARPSAVLLTLGVYAGCLWMAVGVIAPAFRLGTMVRAGYFFMEEDDIKYWEENGYFLFGFVLKESDSVHFSPSDTVEYFGELLHHAPYDTLSFFQERETLFREIWREECQFFTNQYRIGNWIQHNLYRKQLYLSDLSIWNLDYRFNLGTLELIVQSSGDPVPFHILVSNAHSRVDKLLRGCQLFMKYQQDRLYQTFRSKQLDLRDLWTAPDAFSDWATSDWLDRSYLYDYYLFKNQNLSKINISLIEKYHIPITVDTLPLELVNFIRPRYLLTMEDAIRSVRHARQYLNEWIILRHYRVLLCFLLLPALLLFAAPYLSFRNALGALAVAVGGTAVNAGLSLDSEFMEHSYFWNASAYLILPFTGVLLLLYAALRQRRYGWVPFAFHLLVVGLAAVLFFALFGEKWVFTTDEIFMGKPVDLAFFGVQAVGLVGMLLMAYVQALPRRG